MKRFSFLILMFCLTGCANINVPNYVRDEYPYKRLFYAPFDKVKDVTQGVLEEEGWTVVKESDPALFEVERGASSDDQPQTMIYTEIRQVHFFVGSKYTRLNAFLRSLPDGATEVELRYLSISSIVFKETYKYRNDKAIEQILDAIEENLN